MPKDRLWFVVKTSLMSVLSLLLCFSLAIAQQKTEETSKAPCPHKASADAAKISSAKLAPAESGEFRISEEDRCPVCAMVVAKHPKHAAAMVLKDGRAFYFCGNGCLIRTWLHPEIYLNEKKENVSKLWVQDYFSGKPIDAKLAVWVAGSDVVGPMGPALVALKDDAAADTFTKRHGGKRRFKLSEMNDELFKTITGKDAAVHKAHKAAK